MFLKNLTFISIVLVSNDSTVTLECMKIEMNTADTITEQSYLILCFIVYCKVQCVAGSLLCHNQPISSQQCLL